MANSAFIWLLCLTFLRLPHISHALLNRCYYPNGNLGEDYPCDPDADASACCGGSNGNACLSNNLCLGQDGGIIRGSCSAQDWDAPECAQYCLNANTGGTNLISCSNVTNDDTSYCCDHDSGCCDSGDGRFSVGPSNPTTYATWNPASTRFVVLAASTPSTSTPTTTASTSPGASSTTTTAPGVEGITSEPESNATGLTTGAKAGIGIGSAVGAVLIAALVFALWRLQQTHRLLFQRNNENKPSTPAQNDEMATDTPFMTQVQPDPYKYYIPTELDGRSSPRELEAHPQSPQELPTGTVYR